MEAKFHALSLWIHLHPEWAGLATFLIAFVESLVLVGYLVPGSVVLSGLGALVGSGVVPAQTIFIWAIVGAVAGDGISYWLGYRYHAGIKRMWPFSKFPQIFKKGEAFFEKHGGKGIFIGRFVGPVRPILPTIVGMLQVKPLRFFTVDILSAILWAPAYMLPGILLGAASTQYAPDKTLYLILYFIAAVAILTILLWLFRKFSKTVAKLWHQKMDKLWQHLKTHNAIIYRLYREHSQPDSARPLNLFIFGKLFALFSLTIWVLAIIQPHWLISLNTFWLNVFAGFRTPSSITFALIIHNFISSHFVVGILSVSVLFYLNLRKDWHAAYIFISLLAVAVGLTVLLKSIAHIQAPQIIIGRLRYSSFPNTPLFINSVIYGYLVFLITHASRSNFTNKIIDALYLIFMLAIAFSQMLLGLAWFSDIAGSYLLATALLSFIIIGYRCKERKNLFTPLPIILMTVLTILLIGSWQFVQHQQHQRHDFSLKHPSHQINISHWWHSDTSLLPIYQRNHLNRPTALFNVQWFSSLDTIRNELSQHGWTLQAQSQFQRIKQQFLGRAVLLSPLPRLFQLSKPVLTAFKPLKGKSNYLVLELWNSAYWTPLESIYIGTLQYHIHHHIMWWKHAPCPKDTGTIFKQFIQPLHNVEHRMLSVKLAPSIKTHLCVAPDNKVMLIRAIIY